MEYLGLLFQSNVCKKFYYLLGWCQELYCGIYRNFCNCSSDCKSSFYFKPKQTWKPGKLIIYLYCMLFYIQQKLLCSFQAPSNPDCGKTKVCFSQPSSCDPTANTGCYFMAVQTSSNQSEMRIEMFGQADGYVAIGFSDDQEMVRYPQAFSSLFV